MPYHKVGKDDWVSPRGTHINDAQHRLWEAQGGKWPGEKTSERKMAYAKGGDIRSVGYAKGGPVLGRTVNFMKTEDEFRSRDEGNPAADEDQLYGKAGEGAGSGFTKPPKAASKSLKAIKPKK